MIGTVTPLAAPAPKEDWQLKLAMDGDAPSRTLGNLILIMSSHPDWIDVLDCDRIGGRPVTLRPPPIRQGDRISEPTPGPWTQDDTSRTISWFGEAIGFEPRERDVIMAVSVVARRSHLGATTASGTIAAELDAWRDQGPLIHEPTDFATLDNLTGGGPVYGSRWYISGAPDASKTAFLVQLAHIWASRGVTVGMLAVDEEPADLVSRFVQRKGYSRTDAERRDARTIDAMQRDLADLPIRFYCDGWTIESAAEDLHRAANGGKAALLIDSLQTVQCNAELLAERELAEVQAVTARTRAIRAVATTHQLITVTASELGRASYASDEARRNTSTLAGSKWSGAVEYSARVLIGLRSVADETDLIDVEIAKNKHGPRDEHVYLRIDRASQSLWEADYTPEPSGPGQDRAAQAKTQALGDAELIREIIGGSPGIGMRELYAAAKAQGGLSKDRVGAGLSVLGDAVEYAKGPNRSIPMTLKNGGES